MIQLLIPAVVFAGLVAGCSKKSDSSERNETLPDQPRSYFLSDTFDPQDARYLIMDMDLDGYLSPQDQISYSDGHGLSDLSDDSKYIDNFARLLDGLGQQDLWTLPLATAEAYLQYQNWQGKGGGMPNFLSGSLDSDMQMLEEVEDFALDRGLEFSAELYLKFLREKYEWRYAERGCGENHTAYCREFSNGLDYYFGSVK